MRSDLPRARRVNAPAHLPFRTEQVGRLDAPGATPQ